MKKVRNLVLGGLQQKIFNLVLLTIIIMVATIMGLGQYQSAFQSELISETTATQREKLHDTTTELMDAVATNTMATDAKLQAVNAEAVFKELGGEVEILGEIAKDLYEHPEAYPPQEVSEPDPAMAGTVCTQVLTAAGVDLTQPDVAAEVERLSAMTKLLSAVFGNMENLNTAFVSSPKGFMLLADAVPEAKFRDDGSMYHIDVTSRPWYTGAIVNGGLYFTGLEKDTFTDRVGIVCSMPIYHNGELVCVVGADIFLDSMQAAIEASGETAGFICIIDQNGHVIFSPEKSGVFAPAVTSAAVDLRKAKYEELAQFVTNALKSETGTQLIDVGGTSYYMAGAPIKTVGWALVNVIDFDTVNTPTVQMQAEFDDIVYKATAESLAGTDRIRLYFQLLIVVITALALAAALILSKRIVGPLTMMTKEIKKSIKGAFTFEMKDDYKTGDEIEVLANAFEAETIRNARYIKHLRTITAEKERIGTELALATNIQEESLPSIFPPFPNRQDLDIYASMNPAKEVGGDFYDFFLIDDDHLAMVIADVSGKGVPAALFMMMSNILLKTHTMLGGSPREVLARVNDQICSNNQQEMFVTAWLGIMTISTGEVVASNAGHEYPIIKKADGSFELFKDKHGFVLGGLEGVPYKDYSFTLEKGGALFLYTDGVTEAVDKDTTAFGNDRLLAALNQEPEADCEHLIKNMKAALDEFVGTADQFDDVTMFAIKRV